ncbi:MAG: chorismate mutase [Acidobacteria bacterium]|nr:chorismate mutase [Acidobacteriota bacterium]
MNGGAERQDILRILRERIDVLDEQLVRLLNARAACAVEVGRAKEALGLPIYQPEREHEVLEHVARANSGPLDEAAIRRLFERIIDEARRLERLAQRG